MQNLKDFGQNKSNGLLISKTTNSTLNNTDNLIESIAEVVKNIILQQQADGIEPTTEFIKGILQEQGVLKQVEELEKKGSIEKNKLIKGNLELSEKKYELLVNNLNEGIWQIDKNSITTFVNPKMAEMLGYTTDEMIGKTLFDFMDEQGKNIASENVDRRKKGIKEQHEFEFIHKNGSKIYVSLETSAIIDDNGNYLGAIAGIQDITDRKNSRNLLIKEKEKFNTIFMHSPIAIEYYDSNGNLININNSCKNIFGIENINEILGFKLFEDPNISPDIKTKLMNGEDVRYESEFDFDKVKRLNLYKTTCSGIKLLDIIITPLLNNNLEVTGHIVQIQDITQRKQLEEQLQIRQRMDSIGNLASGIAHDFNNILSGIIGYLEMIKDDINDIELDESLTKILSDGINNVLTESFRATALIKQLQNLSQNDIPTIENMDVYKVIEDVFSLLNRTIDKNITKIIDLKEGEFYIKGDINKLHQVFLNLGTNSYDAIKESDHKYGKYIKVTAKNYKSCPNDIIGFPDGDYIHISFEDNGVGMSDEVLRKAFDPLFTTKTKGVQKGQGLGLAMVYNIITKFHNGFIYIDSKKGKGTTINIYLPKAMPVEDIKPKKEIEKLSSGNETILLVEDDEMIRKLVEKMLEKEGYKILTANDGKEGLEKYIENKDSVDLVVLDLTMPRMSGQDVLKEMLKIKDDVKVIISSGQSNEQIRLGILSRAKGYLNKPYKNASLFEIVRNVLDVDK